MVKLTAEKEKERLASLIRQCQRSVRVFTQTAEAEHDPAIKASFYMLAQRARRTLEKATGDLNKLEGGPE